MFWIILCRLPEKDRRDSRWYETLGQGRKRKMKESEETEEIKTFSLFPYLLQEWQALPNSKPISFGRPREVRYTTLLPHPNTISFTGKEVGWAGWGCKYFHRVCPLDMLSIPIMLQQMKDGAVRILPDIAHRHKKVRTIPLCTESAL